MKYPFTRKTLNDGYRREVSYKVDGFWPAIMIRICQSKGIDGEWRATEISWSAGGRDGSLNGADAAWNISCAIRDAVKIARKWDKKKQP